MLKLTCLLAFLAVLSASSAQLTNPSEPANPSNWGDLIVGVLTRSSILIHESRFNGTSFEWRGRNQISRFEVLNQDNNNNNPAFLLITRGGVTTDFLQLWSDSNPVNSIVRIFSTPQNRTLGWRSHIDTVVNTTRIRGRAPLNVNLTGAFNANFVEFHDLTNGTGSFIQNNGVTNPLNLRIRSQIFQGEIDYAVTIHGEAVTPNHHEIGQLTNTSVQIGSEVISATNLTWDNSFTFRLPDHRFDYARLTDLTPGTGGRVQRSTTFNDQLQIFFTRTDSLAFLLQVYGSPLNSTDITVGELQPGSELLESETINSWDTRATIVLRTQHPIDRIEVRNQNRRDQVRATLVTGEVGGQLVVVLFETDQRQFIHFVVRAFGRRNREV